MKLLLLVLILSSFSFPALSQHQHQNMDSKMHETHMKCMEKSGKSMEECMKDKSCKDCMQKMEVKQNKKESKKAN